MKYEISIRVTFPEEITRILRQEKTKFITEYGSCYKSEPHITLYLDSYTAEGYPKLLEGLRRLQAKPFTITLLEPRIRIENHRHRNLYVVDISHKQQLHELHDRISELAIPYRSLFIREKTQQELERQGIHTNGSRENLKKYQIQEESFDPHITLGKSILINHKPILQKPKRTFALLRSKK